MTVDKEKKVDIKIEITYKGNLSIQTITKLKNGWTETNMILIQKEDIKEFVKDLNNL